ncbi:MAG: hypothetical protein IK990_00395 [Ruminiclostridium sp.]|nr:hypothetical protein [Ruminiclostridium sp.]
MSTDYFSESSSRMNFWYSDGYKVPEIISFTQLLKWNYAEDYAAFIRYAYKTGSLPINYDAFYGMETLPEITEVCIVEGIYDRMSRLSFSMKVVCGILFTDRASGEQFTQKVCVEGFHEFDDYTAKYKRRNSSNYFLGIAAYNDSIKKRSHNRLDEYLVPVMNKRDFDKYAYNFLEMYYPEALEEDMKIEPEKLVERLGFNLRFETLSKDGSISGTTVFRDKWVSTYKGKKIVKKHIPHNTVIVSKREDIEKRSIIMHECVHILSHNLFYELQNYYRELLSSYSAGRSINFIKNNDCEGLKWAETQANAIPSHISMYYERVCDLIENFRDKLGRNVDNTDHAGLRSLIDRIAHTYGVSRNSAKKRVIELGYKQARGVYEWGYMEYAEDFDVPYNFPDDYTYSLSLYEMSKILGKSLIFDKYVYSGAFIYADGHLVLNLPKYVVKRYDKYYLTEYAKANMSECCIPFKRIYSDRSYNYTVGELNKDENKYFYQYELEAETRRTLDKVHEQWLLQKYYLDNDGKNMSVGETIRYHMTRLDMTVECLSERTGLGIRTIIGLRGNSGHAPKLETILAVVVGLGLEDMFCMDLLEKANLTHMTKSETYQLYRLMVSVKPDISVYQINEYLTHIGKKPWTKDTGKGEPTSAAI